MLDGSRAYESLVDVPADQEDAALDGLVRVVPGSPEDSFLWQKIQPDLDPAYGDVMPFSSNGVTQRQLDAITEWILLGAPND